MSAAYTWRSDKARRISRVVSGSGADAFGEWCTAIADGFGEWAGERVACGEDPLPFADYCADLLYWEDRTGWAAEQVAWYFGSLPPRCHAVIVAEIRHAIGAMGSAS